MFKVPIADSSLRSPNLQENDQHCRSRNQWRQGLRSKGNTRGNHQPVQETVDEPQDTLECAWSCIALDSFANHLPAQGELIRGKVNLTCDAWQASNADAYFAVTGHWVEESTPGVWSIKAALFGFTQLNTAHNGKRLGQALFKVVQRLEILDKVCIKLRRSNSC
jgi:hypothetical protein